MLVGSGKLVRRKRFGDWALGTDDGKGTVAQRRCNVFLQESQVAAVPQGAGDEGASLRGDFPLDHYKSLRSTMATRDLRLEELKGLLLSRGYKAGLVNQAVEKAKMIQGDKP